MFARKVSACLKPNTLKMFQHLMEFELVPWLRAQEGFLDLIVLADTEGIEVQAISFWDRAANAEACSSGNVEGVLKSLAGLLDRIPVGKTFQIVSSTLERFAQPVRTETESAVAGLDSPHADHDAYDTGV
jgi:hypothetical protein